MAEPTSDETTPAARADVVTTRVNVAFPFSAIRVEQPSEDLAALAELVRDMTEVLMDVAPSAKADELAKRAQQLTVRLK